MKCCNKNGDTAMLSLLTSPHLWEPGIEYDFGDGTFGQRFVGGITTGTSMYNEALFSGMLEHWYIMVSDGWFHYGGKYRIPINAYISTSLYSFLRFEDGIGLWFHSQCGNVRTNDPYDIWVRYLKSYVE